ncbi:hypothetical protein [Bacillus phage BSTP8]|nr:hypothetical protein BSTP5_046 [Bacillus phage BSTP5]QRI44315.1 hypothetical protein [Bacillus phage BSTP8]QRI44453.1 hypothetical protein [Bacillus phage BSTP10]QRI44501.1 hypothetical protein [Bacillus phage BSTP12]
MNSTDLLYTYIVRLKSTNSKYKVAIHYKSLHHRLI